jgi:hypothetical protein
LSSQLCCLHCSLLSHEQRQLFATLAFFFVFFVLYNE